MGQYHLIVNLDRREYITPHYFGDGAKLLEFGASGNGAMTALAVLLADSNNRGGGDLRSDHPVIGSWAGCRITITGDYGDAGRWPEAGQEVSLYSACCAPEGGISNFKDVSDDVVGALCDDTYVAANLKEGTRWVVDARNQERLGPNLRKLHGMPPLAEPAKPAEPEMTDAELFTL